MREQPAVFLFLMAVAVISGRGPACADIPRSGLAPTGYSATIFSGFIPVSTAESSTISQPSTDGTLIIDNRPRSNVVINREECLKDLRMSGAGWASLGGSVMGGITGLVFFMTTPATNTNPFGHLLVGAGGGAIIGAVVGYFTIDERKCTATSPTDGVK